jgi:hypothetical protein
MGLGSGIRKKPIPDPGCWVKKTPYPAPGSATLVSGILYFEKGRIQIQTKSSTHR